MICSSKLSPRGCQYDAALMTISVTGDANASWLDSKESSQGRLVSIYIEKPGLACSSLIPTYGDPSLRVYNIGGLGLGMA
jgi:hypothetical protein